MLVKALLTHAEQEGSCLACVNNTPPTQLWDNSESDNTHIKLKLN